MALKTRRIIWYELVINDERPYTL